MKKTLILTALLGSALVFGDTATVYTWQGGSEGAFDSAANWDNGLPATPMSGNKDHKEETLCFIIGDNVDVDGSEKSIYLNKSTFQLGADSSLTTTWDFKIGRLELSRGSSVTGGAGLEIGTVVLAQDASLSVTGGNGTITALQVNDSLTDVDHDFITNLKKGGNIDFGANGKLAFNTNMQPEGTKFVSESNNQAFTLSAEITLPISDTVTVETRDLIVAKNIWWRDGSNSIFDYANSTITETNGITLRQAELAQSKTAAWVIDGQTYSNDQLASLGGVYRFVATYDDGISIQYATPEPATATLSLLALAALAARRKRH